jgi:hypothetical protein
MQKILFITLLAFIVTSCASVMESTPGFTHTAALMIGDSKDNVISQAEHICGKPKLVGHVEGAPEEIEVKRIEIRRYGFFNDSDVLLYFYNGIFFQAALIDPKSTTYPPFRQDYKEVNRESPGPAGYLLTLQGKVGSIKTIQRNDTNNK